MTVASIAVSSLISRSAGYVRANVNRANADGNPYLTKAEARALPKDLRDNFEAHRELAQANGTVTARKFVSRYTSYVAVNVKKADANHDGRLSAGEVKNLPKDLRDNFWNAYFKR